jgi:hypothetical protein
LHTPKLALMATVLCPTALSQALGSQLLAARAGTMAVLHDSAQLGQLEVNRLLKQLADQLHPTCP